MDGTWEMEIYKKLFNKCWGPMNTSVLEPLQRVVIPVVTLISSHSSPSGLNVYTLTQGGGLSAAPHSLTLFTKASQRYVQRHKGILGNASCSLWLEHKIMLLFLVSFLFILQWCDLIKWN